MQHSCASGSASIVGRLLSRRQPLLRFNLGKRHMSFATSFHTYKLPVAFSRVLTCIAHPVSFLSAPLGPPRSLRIAQNQCRESSNALLEPDARSQAPIYLCLASPSPRLSICISLPFGYVSSRARNGARVYTRAFVEIRDAPVHLRTWARSMRDAHRSSRILSIVHFFDRICRYSLAPFHRNREYEATDILA